MEGLTAYVDTSSASFADDSAGETASGRGATSSSRRRWGFRSFFSTTNEDAGLNSIDDEDDNFEMLQTTGLSDRNTIVDMSLRTDRFVLLVALALAAAFSFAYFTNSAVKLATVASDDEQKVTDTVELFNTIFGFILFAGGKVFEVYCETLIFPTLTTYLHNCSLYPGDQPARVHSPIKVRAIFWGLKTVIILMNVAFASVFVGQRTISSSATRRLSVSDFGEALRVSSPLQDVYGIDGSSTRAEDLIFRSQMLSVADDEDVVCDNRWIDAPAVSSGFPIHDWSSELELRFEAVAAVDIPAIGEYLAKRDVGVHTDEIESLDAVVTAQDVLRMFEKGYRVAMRSLAINGLAAPVNSLNNADDGRLRVKTVRELVQIMARRLNDSGIENIELDATEVHLRRRELSEDFEYTSVTIAIPRQVSPHDGRVECGQNECIFSDETKLPWSSGTFVTPFESNEDSADDSSMLVVAVDRVFEAPTAVDVTEKILLSMGKLSWQLERLDERHRIECDSDSDSDTDTDACVGVSIPLQDGRGEVLAGKRVLSTNHQRASPESPFQLLKTTPAIAWTPQGGYSTWYSLKSGLSLADGVDHVTASEEPIFKCTSAVDSFHQYTTTTTRFSTFEDGAYIAALQYLLQDGVSVRYRDPFTRRLALAVEEASSSSSNDSSGMKDIQVAVPTLSAFVTIAGCGVMLVLMGCVVFLPTPRVKLAPNTTPAAQYVQILTDDLYPDIVHKKRLRFANGDCLLFNEYIVDSIVLHAERNHKKKIYL